MNYDNILQNLKDAGCAQPIINEILMLINSGSNTCALKLLAKHKTELLKSLHENQKQINCLDFLIFQIKQKENI